MTAQIINLAEYRKAKEAEEAPTERAAGQKKERSGLQSACDELIDKGAFITGE